MSQLAWTTIDASDLIEAESDSSLSDHVPEYPGIYVWRRRFTPPATAFSSPEGSAAWLSKIATQPVGRISRAPLSHCVWSEGLQIGGGGLSSPKQQTVDKVSNNPKLRRIVVNYVASLDAFAPPIYIGHAKNLRRRVKQHLNNETGLFPYVSETLHLAWDDLQFCYFLAARSTDVSPDTIAVLELLELIAQRALAPFGTTRPG